MNSALTTRPRPLAGRFYVLLASMLVMLLGLPLSVFSADVPIATVPVGDSPVAIGLNPFSPRVYVANYYGNSVSVIDGVSDTVTSTVPTGDWSIPIAVVANPLAVPARAYVAEFWSNQITVIDEASNAATATMASNGVHAGGPRALALDPSGSSPKLFVADYGAANVTVFDAVTYQQLAAVPVGAQPRALGIFVSLPRTRVYVANRGSASVTIIDGQNNTVVNTVGVGAAPKAIAVDDSTGYAYITCEESNEVWVVDDSDAVTATIGVGRRPVGVAVDSTNGRLFVGNYDNGTVSVIRTADFSHEATLAVGTQPWGIAFDEGDGKAFVTNYGSSTVSVIDSALTVTSVPTGYRPYAIAVDQGASPHKAYAGNWGSDTVTVIDEPEGLAALDGLATESAYAAADDILVGIDPEPVEYGGNYFAEGDAVSARQPYPAAISGVFVRLGDSATWSRAEITEGAGTSAVRWRAPLGQLETGDELPIEVVALDQRSAAASVSDGGTSIRSSSAGGGASAVLGLAEEPLATLTTLRLVPRGEAGTSAVVLEATVSCVDAPDVPYGRVVFERLVEDEWAEEGRADLDSGGTATFALERRPGGTFRALYLGNDEYVGSVSAELRVSPGSGSGKRVLR